MSTGVRCIASVVPSVLAFGIAFAPPFVMNPVAVASPVTQDEGLSIRMTDVVSSGGDALRQAAGEGDIGMLIDDPNLSVTDAHTVVFAVQDAQAAGRDVIAIVESDVEDGSAVVAAACQGLVTVGSASLTGCSDAWCGSPSRREALAAQLEKSGGRDRAIAERLLGGTSALSYSPAQGAQSSAPPSGIGSIILAQQGKPMKLTAGALQTIGWTGPPQADVASAMAAIVAGQVKVPPKAPKRSAGSGSTPPPPPGGKAAPPPPPTGALPPDAAERLKNLRDELTALKATLEKFDCYFTGGCGVWTESSKSLGDVWKKKNMTKHQATVKSCKDLQEELIAIVNKVSEALGPVERDAKALAPQRLKTLEKLEQSLKTIKYDILQNRSRGYEKSSKEIMETEIK